AHQVGWLDGGVMVAARRIELRGLALPWRIHPHVAFRRKPLEPLIAIGRIGFRGVEKARRAAGVAVVLRCIAAGIIPHSSGTHKPLTELSPARISLRARRLRKPRDHFRAAVVDQVRRPAAEVIWLRKLLVMVHERNGTASLRK